MLALPSRALGQQGLTSTAVGFGCFGLSGPYGAADPAESIATIQHAIALGVTLYDTAEMYGPYTNEELLGRALRGRRDDVIVATKFGWRIENGRTVGVDSRPEHIRAVVEGSLRRLGTDRIDLLYQHRVDPDVPIEDVVGTMADLVRAGTVRYLGLSEASARTIRRAHAVHPISVVQSEYSLWERSIESEVIPTMRELGIGLVPFSPLGRGFLTGSARRAEEYGDDDFRRNDPRYQGANFDANMRAASVVRDIAAAKHATPGQIALAWLLHRGPDIVPIPGTRSRAHLDENVAAVHIMLDANEMARLDASLAPNVVAGPRYNERNMSFIDRG